jgi:hypothetical protein
MMCCVMRAIACLRHHDELVCFIIIKRRNPKKKTGEKFASVAFRPPRISRDVRNQFLTTLVMVENVVLLAINPL